MSRFFSRASGGKYQLDVHEIRAGFVAAETAYDRVRRLRAERVSRVVALETPTPVGDGSKLILHGLPVGVLQDAWARFLAMRQKQIANLLQPIGGLPESWGFNLDGFVLHNVPSFGDDLRRQCYTQLFRDGGLEVVSGRVLLAREEKAFYAWGMEQIVIGHFARYQEFWQLVGVTPPVLVGLALTGVKGWRVLHHPSSLSTGRGVFDRDVVILPEVAISDFNLPADVVLRPLFDVIWSGGGWPGSPNYREGRWVAPPT